MIQVNGKLRVCIVSAILPPAYGGAEVAAFKYATRLNASPDSKAIIIGWDRNGAYKNSGINYDFVHSVQFPERTKDVKGVMVYYQQYNHLWNCFRALIKPMWKYRDEYDYIHNFNSGFAFNRVSILIGKLLGKKVITETSLVGDDDPLSLGRFLSWKDYFKPKFVRYLFYKMADRYVSKSNVITEIFEKSKIPMSKVVEIPYSADVSKFIPLDPDEKRKKREKMKLWKDGMIILFVGGINIRKGVHLLVDAFISIEDKYPDLKLLIVGPTYKYDKNYILSIKEKIRSSNLSDKIYLTEENVSNVEEYMQCSDIFILPSRQEGFPISIIEAMSTGLAVIASDIPEISRAQIESGKDGYVFPVGDSEKLAMTIEKLISKKENVGEMGTIARQKVIGKWSTEIVDKSYRQLYKSLELPEKDGFGEKRNAGEKKIKILYTIPNFNAEEGGENLLNVISELDKNIFEPGICCQHEKGDLLKTALDLEIPVHISSFGLATKPGMKGLRSVHSLSGFFRKLGPDIIHSFNHSDDYSEVLASKISGIKWVYTKRNMSWGNNSWKSRKRISDRVITHDSETMENFLKGPDKHFFIPYGVKAEEFTGLSKDESLIKKHELYDSYPIILNIANVIPDKGTEFIINGFYLIHRDYERAKLVIVGDDTSAYAGEMKSLVKELGIEGKVVFAGRQNGVKPYLSIADIFLAAPKRSGQGISVSLLEAMASGIVSYGSDVPGISDQLREFPQQLFEACNPGAVANKIIHAMNLNDEEKIEIVNRQREFIRVNYSLGKEVAKLQELYLALAGESVN